MGDGLEIDAYRKGRELFVLLHGQLVLAGCSSAKERLASLFNPQIDQAYIYLAELTYLDSAGLGLLVGLKMQANRNRSRFILLAPPPRVEDIFHVSKLDTIFDIRGGAEAGVVRSSFVQDEFRLWRDSKDARQLDYQTQNQTDPPVAQMPRNGLAGGASGDEVSAKTRQWCADAVEYIRQGDYQRAIDAYVRALNLNPENLSALNNLGIVYEKRPEWYPQARETWNRVLSLSQTLLDEKHADRARKHLESLAKLM